VTSVGSLGWTPTGWRYCSPLPPLGFRYWLRYIDEPPWIIETWTTSLGVESTSESAHLNAIYNHASVIRPNSAIIKDSKRMALFANIIWAIMIEKAHLLSPEFGARAGGNTNKAKWLLSSQRTAWNGALVHSRCLWATAQLGMHGRSTSHKRDFRAHIAIFNQSP